MMIMAESDWTLAALKLQVSFGSSLQMSSEVEAAKISIPALLLVVDGTGDIREL